MPRIALFGLPLAATLVLSGCFGWDPFDGNVPTEKEIAEKIHLNPKPQKPFRILISIEDAPGEFRYAEASASYQALRSEACTYPTGGMGTFSVPSHQLDVPVVRREDGRFELVVYADALLEEDYFGKGICRWNVFASTIELQATGAAGEPSFMLFPSISETGLESELRLFYRKAELSKALHPDGAVIGRADEASFMPEPPSDLFAIHASIEKEFE